MHVLYIGVCPFVLFLLVIVFSDLPRYADSDFPFGIILNVVCSVVIARNYFLDFTDTTKETTANGHSRETKQNCIGTRCVLGSN